MGQPKISKLISKRQKLGENEGETYSKLAAFQSVSVQAEYFNALQAKTLEKVSPLDLDTMKFKGEQMGSTGLGCPDLHWSYQNLRLRIRPIMAQKEI